MATAKDMHPKLAGGMFVFFALGAVGGMLSLVMQARPKPQAPRPPTALLLLRRGNRGAEAGVGAVSGARPRQGGMLAAGPPYL